MNFLSKTFIWRKLRERKILKDHKRVAAICEHLIGEYETSSVDFSFPQKASFDSGKIIWQYWAQGYDNIPKVVEECLASVDKYAADYRIVRLSDANLEEYIDIPDFVASKRSLITAAHFSDILRLMLLKTYGGIWMDATIKLTGPIPEEYAGQDFFLFSRDPKDPNFRYWRNVYAYYFGWAKGFRVNVLNSFIAAKKGNETASNLCNLMLFWWQRNDSIPDYFFFQILFDIYSQRQEYSFPHVSDTLPHYLQQSISDPNFALASKELITEIIPIHKLTYKYQ